MAAFLVPLVVGSVAGVAADVAISSMQTLPDLADLSIDPVKSEKETTVTDREVMKKRMESYDLMDQPLGTLEQTRKSNLLEL